VPHLNVYSRHDAFGSTTLGYLKELCQAGNTVAYEVRNFLHDQQVHNAELFNEHIFPWVADRFADLAAPNECAEILAE
jgi:hypothetical protein